VQLVINSYGAYLRKSGNCFLVKREDKSFEVAVSKVNSILITTSAYITTDAIKLAVDNNIDIVFLDSYGEPYGRVWHPKLGSTTLIRRRQLEIYDTSEGLNLAKEWGLKKLDNQIELLSKLRKTREEKREVLDGFIEEISQSKERMKRLRGSIDARRQDMLSFLLRLGQLAYVSGLGNTFASIVPFSCGGASDAPQLAARVRRRRFTRSPRKKQLSPRPRCWDMMAIPTHFEGLCRSTLTGNFQVCQQGHIHRYGFRIYNYVRGMRTPHDCRDCYGSHFMIT
jgi:hypothetical protein